VHMRQFVVTPTGVAPRRTPATAGTDTDPPLYELRAWRARADRDVTYRRLADAACLCRGAPRRANRRGQW